MAELEIGVKQACLIPCIGAQSDECMRGQRVQGEQPLLSWLQIEKLGKCAWYGSVNRAVSEPFIDAVKE